MAKAANWALTDAEARKCGEQTGLDTLVVHAVLLGTWLERPDVRLRDFNVGQSRAVGFQLFQALLAVMQLWPLGPVLQIFFQGSLQHLGGEFACFLLCFLIRYIFAFNLEYHNAI